MENDKEKASRYRDRAQRLRTIAGDLTDDSARKVLLTTAGDYEAMALEAERSALIASSRRKSEPPRDI